MEIESETIKLYLKWNKTNLELDIANEETLESLKASIYSLTNVQPEKQKLLFKGKFLKQNDLQLKQLKLTNKAKLMLIGKPEDKQINLQKITDEGKHHVFIEDLTPEEKAKYIKNKFDEHLPVGLNNLGNTCYMNSCLQILFKVKELKERIKAFKAQQGYSPGQSLVIGLQDVFNRLENSGEAFDPDKFLFSAFEAFPQFAQKDESGRGYQQQDIDEFFQLLINSIGPILVDSKKTKDYNLIKDLFQFDLQIKFENKEEESEKSEPKIEKMNKISCIIDNQMNPVNNLADGIKIGLEEEIEKYSEKLERNSQWKKLSKFSSLPKYLVVQKIRFVWREKDIGTNTEARKAKILRNVAFPKVLDIYEFCTEELQTNLKINREKESEMIENQKIEDSKQFEEFKKQHESEIDTFKIYKQFQKQKKEQDQIKHLELLQKDFNDKSEFTGNYELIGVITHKGRSSDTGHYVSWIHSKGDEWMKFDDDYVTKTNTDQILNLKGGGDWHMAYYLLYRKMQLQQIIKL